MTRERDDRSAHQARIPAVIDDRRSIIRVYPSIHQSIDLPHGRGIPSVSANRTKRRPTHPPPPVSPSVRSIRSDPVRARTNERTKQASTATAPSEATAARLPPLALFHRRSERKKKTKDSIDPIRSAHRRKGPRRSRRRESKSTSTHTSAPIDRTNGLPRKTKRRCRRFAPSVT